MPRLPSTKVQILTQLLAQKHKRLTQGGVAGTVRIKDDADDTEEIEWEEFSGPVGIAVERIGGSDGRVSVHFSTRGT